METFNEEALVLRYADYGDNSRMLTMLTPSLGVISAAAHGCRKTGGKMTPCVQPFTYGDYAFTKKGDRYTVTQANVKESFTNISRSLQRFAACVFFLDACAALTPGEQPARDVFSLALTGLYLYDSTTAQTEGTTVYLLGSLFELCGYAIHLMPCVSCGKEIDEPHYQATLGGVACSSCQGMPMSLSAWRALIALTEIEPQKAPGIRLEPWLAKELLSILAAHLQESAGRVFDTYAYYCRMPQE